MCWTTAQSGEVRSAQPHRLPRFLFQMLVKRTASHCSKLQDLQAEMPTAIRGFALPARASQVYIITHEAPIKLNLLCVSLHNCAAGKETINTLYGTRVAVLAGDFLFAQSSWLIANLENMEVGGGLCQLLSGRCCCCHSMSLCRWL